jgi:predicted AlkP superfamily pyrophosphatase or phosphodiesterase
MALAVFPLAGLLLASSLAEPTPRPALAVVVVFDQLRARDLVLWEPLFGPGGFGGLGLRNLAHYDAEYTYAATETGPGHATIATGASPNVHGIASNAWPTVDGRAYVVEDPASPVLGREGEAGASARYLKVPTLGDTLKMDTGGRAKVVSLSIKDRGAILLGGRGADLAVWYDPAIGRFTSSKAYAQTLPTWLDGLATSLPADARKNGRWSPLPAPRGRAALLPVDDRPGEAPRHGYTRTFPHDLASLADEDARHAYRGSPQSIEDLFTLALQAVQHEKLGVDETPDLLHLSISSTDFVGHWHGPDSLEYVDMLRRADLALRAFLASLDARVGRSRFVVAVTADHGVTQLPEAVLKHAKWGGRIAVEPLQKKLHDVAQSVSPGIAAPLVHPPHIFVDVAKASPQDRDRLLRAISDELSATPGIAHVYRADALDTDVDPFTPAFREMLVEGRSGQLFIRQEPRVVFTWGTDEGTDHGTPYVYDKRVPFLLVGPEVRRGRYAQSADVRDIAPTLAFMLGVSPPDAAQGRPVGAVGAESTSPLLGR